MQYHQASFSCEATLSVERFVRLGAIDKSLHHSQFQHTSTPPLKATNLVSAILRRSIYQSLEHLKSNLLPLLRPGNGDVADVRNDAEAVRERALEQQRPRRDDRVRSVDHHHHEVGVAVAPQPLAARVPRLLRRVARRAQHLHHLHVAAGEVRPPQRPQVVAVWEVAPQLLGDEFRVEERRVGFEDGGWWRGWWGRRVRRDVQ